MGSAKKLAAIGIGSMLGGPLGAIGALALLDDEKKSRDITTIGIGTLVAGPIGSMVAISAVEAATLIDATKSKNAPPPKIGEREPTSPNKIPPYIRKKLDTKQAQRELLE